ncbi:hypothetical protein P256_00693 [Acinetobacter nectaris CIP 110549]|uniref:DUF2335 domain-containing protein n=1 Tax=Acinetobacter nectaris CIP 110549 TaxID=1392540 RepID=V2TQ74_9GAMM|nr:DUF2335 domain-containing protein [Acinetobacter nectaris]ESK40246.1 hypothetical protein P256_00693 [Acinetobacter nectaris CIP 110549]
MEKDENSFEIDGGFQKLDDNEYIKPPRMPNQKHHTLHVEQHTVRSPYLPPNILKQYDEIYPGMARELMSLTFEHQRFSMEKSRHEMEIQKLNHTENIKINDANIAEMKAVSELRKGELRIKSIGQWFALLTTLSLLGISVVFASMGYPLLATACIGIIVSLAIVMFLQKNKKDDDS